MHPVTKRCRCGVAGTGGSSPGGEGCDSQAQGGVGGKLERMQMLMWAYHMALLLASETRERALEGGQKSKR